jgi:hypothetical protein
VVSQVVNLLASPLESPLDSHLVSQVDSLEATQQASLLGSLRESPQDCHLMSQVDSLLESHPEYLLLVTMTNTRMITLPVMITLKKVMIMVHSVTRRRWTAC